MEKLTRLPCGFTFDPNVRYFNNENMKYFTKVIFREVRKLIKEEINKKADEKMSYTTVSFATLATVALTVSYKRLHFKARSFSEIVQYADAVKSHYQSITGKELVPLLTRQYQNDLVDNSEYFEMVEDPSGNNIFRIIIKSENSLRAIEPTLYGLPDHLYESLYCDEALATLGIEPEANLVVTPIPDTRLTNGSYATYLATNHDDHKTYFMLKNWKPGSESSFVYELTSFEMNTQFGSPDIGIIAKLKLLDEDDNIHSMVSEAVNKYCLESE